MTGAHYRLVYDKAADANTQAAGAFTVAVDANAVSHQISTTKNGGTAGTLAVEVKPRGSGRFETLTVNGVAVSLDLTADSTFGPFDGSIDEFRLTPSDFDGTDFDVRLVGY
jgi:hypothetical protein